MFKKLFSKNISESIFAYASGDLVKIEDIPDPVFSQKLMGEGVAILPSNGQILAPVDGEIILIAETKHAFALRTALGEEILIHIGLETMNLKGQGFNFHIKLGDKVKKGQIIVEADLDFIKENASSTIIPMIITNSNEDRFNFKWEDINKVKAGETKLFETQLK
ncbi:PTS system glucose-specific IIA component [Clostridium saccharoperbutylacetonicum]|uniref:PTS system IIA component, Glc family n=1 Tax=Clostridium saccharoperbutylacetonicum N1-4(HMT) TaxID=931276 RepID=M1N7M4_9CLOT|nr:PTS glucose transporter subunit IIA [Clostridium saccharoperbutylacetonicum]AGF59377.1 PTS system IIA component, Glc family [Clostridium saccharoperbutylacetonicum N1-4(HMT)]NRT59832.1 PTS system glucose-specific IIA component [Clostridium saccharoperbutylacetonicum]NSB23144.1 PTS system glucose-specific IIA component [Clostridium saccharoperbutylacetonicum]NSB42515.1 PTS system glucose-specific IIA component [Clostridium saccharoperbutylacetonicum]